VVGGGGVLGDAFRAHGRALVGGGGQPDGRGGSMAAAVTLPVRRADARGGVRSGVPRRGDARR
jgi:hypothetical protein